MPLRTFLAFGSGSFQQLPEPSIPQVILEAVRSAIAQNRDDPDVETFLVEAGGVTVESYGCDNESIDVFRIGPYWYIEHFTQNGCDARIVISTLADWMTFQATWLAPVSEKIMRKGWWADWARAVYRAEARETTVILEKETVG
jgi:hypothetical protein